MEYLSPTGRSSITEGIGTGRVTANSRDSVDDAIRVSDAETMRFVSDCCAKKDCSWQHVAINDCRAYLLASNGPGHTIATILVRRRRQVLHRGCSQDGFEKKALPAMG